MTIVLELNEMQELRLIDQAEALGLAPVDYLKRVAGLEDALQVAEDKFAGKTLADLLGDSLGVVDSSDYFNGQPSDLSTRTGEAFAEMLLEKHDRQQKNSAANQDGMT